MKKIIYSIASDGGFPKNGSVFRKKIKTHIISGSKLYFSTADVHNEYYLMYGANKKNIVKYPFTSIYNNDILKVPIVNSEKEIIRKNLGIKEEKVILSVGQFIHRKGYDVLLKACKELDNNIGVYIIGGEPTEEYSQIKRELKLDNVYFIGFKNKLI